MNNKQTYKKRESSQNSNLLQLLPILLALAIIPLIVLMKEVPTKIGKYEWFNNNEIAIDYFLYYKSGFLMCIGAVMLIFLLYTLSMNRSYTYRSRAFVFLGIYALCALLSTIFSSYRSFSITGVPEQYESLFVLFTYCILCYYSFQIVRSDQNLRLLINALLISLAFLIVLGITQMIGHDFLTSPTGTKLVTTFMKEKLSFSTNFGNDVYLTFYNPNYVGVYCVLIFPIIFTLFLYEKSKSKKLLYLILSIGLILCLVGSKSATGIITLCFTSFVLLIFNRHIFSEYKKFVYPALAVLIICIIVAFVKFDFKDKLKQKLLPSLTPTLQQIDTKEDGVYITYNNQVLNISYDFANETDFDFYILDESKTPIATRLNEDSSGIIISDSRYPEFLISPMLSNQISLFSITIDDTDWLFTNNNGTTGYYYINCYGNQIKINTTSKNALPSSFDSFATNRGFIWSKTIPLLKKHILIGAGPDCFIFEYPNDDYVGMYNHGFLYQIMTKPHNLYLQTAIQTGVISLIAFLLFYLFYFVSSLRLYIRGAYDTYAKQLGSAILISTFGYMISALINDSSVTVSPIFWILLGIGFSINRRVSQN